MDATPNAVIVPYKSPVERVVAQLKRSLFVNMVVVPLIGLVLGTLYSLAMGGDFSQSALRAAGTALVATLAKTGMELVMKYYRAVAEDKTTTPA